MEKLEQKHLIVEWVNALLGPLVRPLLALLGVHVEAGREVIPDYLVMVLLVVVGYTALCLFLRSRLSVENPSRLQIVLEDLVSAVAGMLEQSMGPSGRRFLPLIGTLGAFILACNYLGLLPGFMSPTSNINVTAGCAITIWTYYHYQGLRTHGVVHYIAHFAGPSNLPIYVRALMFPIEIISHISRVLSLSLRLFGNIFGEELIIAILGTALGMWVAFTAPVLMMGLGLITGGLQAFIFVLLSIIYLQGATTVDQHDEHPGHDHEAGPTELAAA
jgi:F-type H+-transporting ATPase subunit a